jgi:hypothetical protein
MSLPTYDVKCTQCDFCSSVGSEPPLRYRYRLNDGTELAAYRSMGWCYHCDDLRPVEVLPSHSYISDILRMNPKGSTENRETQPKEIYEVHQAILAWLRRRKTFGRCLECGSEDNVALKIGDGYPGRRPVHGFRHTCGGELYLTTGDTRIAWMRDNVPTKFLDEEGYLL